MTTRTRLIATTFTALAIALTTVPASAAPTTVDEAPRVHTAKRQMKQRVRIRRGVKSGEITKGERKAINKQQRHINRTKKRFIANDGKIDKRERRKLQRKQNRASKNIHRAKHNNRSRK